MAAWLQPILSATAAVSRPAGCRTLLQLVDEESQANGKPCASGQQAAHFFVTLQDVSPADQHTTWNLVAEFMTQGVIQRVCNNLQNIPAVPDHADNLL